MQLQERDAMYDRQMRGLRAQYDHMRHEYERRAEAKKGNTGPTIPIEERRVGPDHEAILHARIKDLERQVEHTKSYYLTKLRKREPLVPPSNPSKPSKPRGNETRLQQLQHQLQERDQRIAELEASKASYPLSSPYPPGYRSPSAPSAPVPSTPSPASNVLRLFLASPEASAMVALCSTLHWLSHTVRMDRFEEVELVFFLWMPTKTVTNFMSFNESDGVDGS